MRIGRSFSCRWLAPGMAMAFAASVAWAAERPERIDRQAAVRAAPEVAVEGPTVQEYFDRQHRLHDRLMREMPAGTMERPVRVQLTPEELADMEVPDVDETGRMKVGLVKEVAPGVQVAGLNRKQLSKRSTRLSTGVLRETDDGGFVWAASVTSDQARAIRVHFEDFSIPANANMYIFNRDGDAFGPYERTGPLGTGEFWSHSVTGDTAILLLSHPGPDGARDLNEVSFRITEIGHVGAESLRPGGGEGGVAEFCTFNEPCIENTNCVSGKPSFINNVEAAAAKMRWIFGCCIWICSGGLIADTDTSTQIPYFLTANHCLSRGKEADNLECYFQYQVACGESCPADSFEPAPSPMTFGATIEATNSEGDYTLLRLAEDPPSGTVFLGWNSSPIAFTDGAAMYRIHHPAGAPQAYSEHSVDTSAGTCTQWPRGERIYSRDTVGATEGGSSGSPVVNASGEIVGQLTGACGFDVGDPCNATDNATVDGAFAHYFPEVESILDPGGGGCSADSDCASGEICCSGTCVVPTCSADADCNDGDACTTDTCSNPGTCSASCSNTEPPCQGGDGCCPSGCDSSNDSDCPDCGGNRAPCTSNSDCCSGNCRGGTCRGN